MFLGYVVAMANEGGGMLVLGMDDKHPHKVVGSDFGKGKLGELADAVYFFAKKPPGFFPRLSFLASQINRATCSAASLLA